SCSAAFRINFRCHSLLAALLSGLIFGVIHMELSHLLAYTSMGIVFAFLYVKTKRIIVPIIVHAGMNTIVVLAQYSLTPEDIQKMQNMLDDLQMIFLHLF
ncbi:CPBP family intramembrane metalloprotease, partial [Ralstonia pickettii]|nr:CPBP family intramembrane metalloprotease [Ralstonia pickettii]